MIFRSIRERREIRKKLRFNEELLQRYAEWYDDLKKRNEELYDENETLKKNIENYTPLFDKIDEKNKIIEDKNNEIARLLRIHNADINSEEYIKITHKKEIKAHKEVIESLESKLSIADNEAKKLQKYLDKERFSNDEYYKKERAWCEERKTLESNWRKAEREKQKLMAQVEQLQEENSKLKARKKGKK